MTRQSFLDNFYIMYDKVSTSSAPAYEPSEIELIATEAQEILVKTYYNALSNRLREGFEETEKRIQDLGELVTNAVLTPLPVSIENMPNGRFFELPNTLATDSFDYSDVFWFTVFESAITNETCNGQVQRYQIIEVNHNEYTQLLSDPFNKPQKNKVWRMRVGGRRQELITDGSYSITGYHVRYVRKPQPINLTTNLTSSVTELSDHVCYELLRKTYEIATRDINDPGRLNIDASLIKE